MLKGALMKKETAGSKAIKAGKASKSRTKLTPVRNVRKTISEVNTWADLAKAISKLSKAEQSQPVQVVKVHVHNDAVNALLPGICLGSVGALEIRFARSVIDNKKHEEHIVLQVDGNPFGEVGSCAYEMVTKIVKGKKKYFWHPCFPENHTDECDWSGPAQKIVKAKEKKQVIDPGKDLYEYDIQTVKNRGRNLSKKTQKTKHLKKYPPVDALSKLKKKLE